MSLEAFARVVKGYGVPDDSNSFLLPMHEIELRELVNYSGWKFGTQANKNSVVEAEYAVFGVVKTAKYTLRVTSRNRSNISIEVVVPRGKVSR